MDKVPRVGVGVLILTDDQHVILTLRRKPPEAGSWSITGGAVEFLETLEAAAMREALEETGLTVRIERLLCVTDHLVPEESQHWVSPAYLARIVTGTLHNPEPDKNAEVRAFALDHLPGNLTRTAHNAIRAYKELTPYR